MLKTKQNDRYHTQSFLFSAILLFFFLSFFVRKIWKQNRVSIQLSHSMFRLWPTCTLISISFAKKNLFSSFSFFLFLFILFRSFLFLFVYFTSHPNWIHIACAATTAHKLDLNILLCYMFFFGVFLCFWWLNVFATINDIEIVTFGCHTMVNLVFPFFIIRHWAMLSFFSDDIRLYWIQTN